MGRRVMVVEGEFDMLLGPYLQVPGSATALATSLSVTDVGLPLSSIHALCKRRD